MKVETAFPLRGIGDIHHEIDLRRVESSQPLRPCAGYVLKFPVFLFCNQFENLNEYPGGSALIIGKDFRSILIDSDPYLLSRKQSIETLKSKTYEKQQPSNI
jgi:hypothetical protein